ncbi:MAG: cytochrome c [Acetobacter orientalis]|uniref:c-type cytochrome n=1 Tax=Acetobacter orientalis TaxID=146474 RepID=UPI0039E9272A
MRKAGLSFLLGGLVACSALAGSALAASDGPAVYGTNCAVCHQAGGVGMPGQFPVLKGRIDKIAATPEGKAYLMDVVLNGLHGPIQAGGMSYAGFMPTFKGLSDDDLAAVLSYLTTLGTTPQTFSADDIKAARAKPKKGSELIAERNALNAAHPIP